MMLLGRTRVAKLAFRAIVSTAAVWTTYLPLSASQLSAAELTSPVSLDEADAVVRGHLERVKVLIANQQWDETIDVLRQVADQAGDKVVAVAPGYHIRVRDYCHRRLAGLPPHALASYRGQVDQQARAWLDAATAPIGMAERDDVDRTATSAEKRETLLRRIVDQFYVSSSGDEALWLLGEYALERGDFGAARGYWEQLIEMPPAVIVDAAMEGVLGDKELPQAEKELIKRYYQRRESRGQYELVARRAVDPELMRLAKLLRERGLVGPRGAYPGADHEPAEVFARLILVSILEGSTAWAEAGLGDYAQTYAEARGRLGGREVNFVEALQTLLAESRSWPHAHASKDWPTFAGNFARNRTAESQFDVGRVKWRLPLTPVAPPESEQPVRRPAEDKSAALSYHPVVVDGVVFFHNGVQIFAYDLATGKPAWGSDPIVYQGETIQLEPSFQNRQVFGVARYTLSVHNHRLYARLGPPLTSSNNEAQNRGGGGYLVCLDLARQGAEAWNEVYADEGWSFEGTPVADAERVYVAMRKGGVRPQIHVACFDAENGMRLWRRLICSAESPGQGQYDEITHNLLTLVGDSVYCNTNLGAVASLDARGGEVRWITLYPRADVNLNQNAHHLHRDLTPCVYDRGTLYVAPSDSRHILAIDAAGGLIRWETTLAGDAIHLLGVADDQLFASGDRVWRIHAHNGRILQVWPDESPKGYGRGALMGDSVIWPTRTTLEVFSVSEFERVRQVELSIRDAGGGNTVPAGDYLLIAAGDELVALDRYGGFQDARPTAGPSDMPPPESTPQSPVLFRSPQIFQPPGIRAPRGVVFPR